MAVANTNIKLRGFTATIEPKFISNLSCESSVVYPVYLCDYVVYIDSYLRTVKVCYGSRK